MSRFLNKEEKSKHIISLKSLLGNKVSILGHHYQEQGVIDHCDYTGDSLELAQRIAHLDSEHIVFCGVYFMAESAALLAKEEQSVYLPEPAANCVMSLMSPAYLIERLFKKLTASGRKLIPVAYVNTEVDVKAIVGKYGGATCTSSSADKVLKWALNEGDGVFFLPDKNLAYNTAKNIGIPKKNLHILDIRKKGDVVDLEASKQADIIVWPGLCAIHARFLMQHIHLARENYPNCTIVVHPECTPEVVKASDAVGSTSFIINYANNIPDGSHLVIGTEINLVSRLKNEHKHRIKTTPLRASACSHMAKCNPDKLYTTLHNIANNNATPISIEQETKTFARTALERMMQIITV